MKNSKLVEISKHSSGPHYDVYFLDLNAHTFRIKLTIEEPLKDQVIHFPQWIAGSYMIREFSKHLHNLSAKQNKKYIDITQLSKSSWKLHSNSKTAVTIEYDIYAHDGSVRGAWLDTDRGFFNGTSLFFECEGHENKKYSIRLHSTPLIDCAHTPTQVATHDWKVFTSLKAIKTNKDGWGSYEANSFEELVDTPVLMADAWYGEFKVTPSYPAIAGSKSILHRFAITGVSPSFDGERLIFDAQKICQTVIDFWHPKSKPVIDSYLFILNVVQDGYGGLEHKTSTVLQCKRADLPSLHKKQAKDATEGYIGLLGLISHEYFHTWNVKRLCPSEFSSYRFNTENYTEMLWFFEGFTSYYDDLLLRRSGLITDTQYIKLLGKTINQVMQTPGRHVQSVASSSFDAWIKYYKADENTPNITVSYYTKGALIALCFDLKLRAHNTNLDNVMRELFKRSEGGPVSESDFHEVLKALSNRSWNLELKDWVHGVKELPCAALLQNQGVRVEYSANSLQQQLGLRLDESKNGLHIKIVLKDSVAQAAGFVAGDEWLGVRVLDSKPGKTKSKFKKNDLSSTQFDSSSWRINKLDDLMLFLGKTKCFEALVCRDQRILTLRVNFDIETALADKSNQILTVEQEKKVRLWLG